MNEMNTNKTEPVKRDTYVDLFNGMMKIFTLLASVCFFLGFKSLEIPQSKIINTIASATFGVYLLHLNEYSNKFLWNGIFSTASFQKSPYLIPYTFAVILTVFISCTILELLRSKIFRTLTRGYLS